MTYKVTVTKKDESGSITRDYRVLSWCDVIACKGMEEVFREKPWRIEFEGEVPEKILYIWATGALHKNAPIENLTLNGKPYLKQSGS